MLIQKHPISFSKTFTSNKKTFANLNISASQRLRAPEEIRTPNQQNRNLSFYPIELRVQWDKARQIIQK
jgi:hypothetical protein